MRRWLLIVLLAGAFHGARALGAVFVFETAIGQAVRLNPAALMLSDPSIQQGISIGGLIIGTGYFRVEGDQVDYQLWIQPTPAR